MADGGSLQTTYWATRKADDLVTAIKAKERQYFTVAEQRGLRRMWEIAYCQYYGLNPAAVGDMATQTLAFVGASSEFIRFRLGEVRSFIKQELALSQGERPAFKCVGINTDYATLSQIRSGDQVVSYLYQTGSGEDMESTALEGDAVFGNAFAHVRWDYEGGEEVDIEIPHPSGEMIPDPSGATEPDQSGLIDPATGAPQEVPVMVPATIPARVKSGTPTTTISYPWETISEAYHRRGKPHQWRIVREPQSKWELAAQFPELADKIVAVQFEHDEYTGHMLFGHSSRDGTEDMVIVRHFYHMPCRAIPQGRYVGVVGDHVLWDEPCPLPNRVPVVELCSAHFIGTSFGCSDAWDLIAIQQMIDQLCSDGASNFAKFGRPMIVADEGLQLDKTLLSQGHFIWTKPPENDFPQAISFAAMPPGFMEFLQYLHSRHQSISGLNSVVRGNPDKNITSGQMAALFHSIAIEFRSAEQRALNTFRKELANMYLDMVRAFSTHTPFVAEIAGQSERPYMKEFYAQEMTGIRRVVVEPVSALSRSTAGNLAIADLLIKIEDPRMRAALLKGVESGQWGDFTRTDRNADLAITWENEQLAKGVQCAVVATDDPFCHVPQHLADFDARREQLNTQPDAAAAYLEHIQEHLGQYQMLNPNLARVLRIPEPLPVMGTPAGNAYQSLVGPASPVPDAGTPPGETMEAAQEATGAPQGNDPSGVKLPNPSAPPKNSRVNAQAPGAAGAAQTAA